jgi:hypothetical protein
MHVEGLTYCTNCGEKFPTMEAMWTHEMAAHAPSTHITPGSVGPAPGALPSTPLSPEARRLDIGGPVAVLRRPPTE